MGVFLLLLTAAPVVASCDRVKLPLKRVECERKAGHPVKALELVDDWLVKKPKDKKAAKLRDALQREVVQLQWFSEPEGATVSRDGEELGPTPISLTLDPGRYVFRFTHEGYQPLEREESAIAGTMPKLTAVLEKAPAPVLERPPEPVAEPPAPVPAVTAAAAPRAERDAREAREHSMAPFVLGSAGIFVAIGGGVLILTSLLSPTLDSAAQTRQWVGYGLVGAGAAAGIAAIIWLLVDRRPGAGAR